MLIFTRSRLLVRRFWLRSSSISLPSNKSEETHYSQWVFFCLLDHVLPLMFGLHLPKATSILHITRRGPQPQSTRPLPVATPPVAEGSHLRPPAAVGYPCLRLSRLPCIAVTGLAYALSTPKSARGAPSEAFGGLRPPKYPRPPTAQ